MNPLSGFDGKEKESADPKARRPAYLRYVAHFLRVKGKARTRFIFADQSLISYGNQGFTFLI